MVSADFDFSKKGEDVKDIRRITAFVLVLVLLCGSMSFAAQTASIVSPAENTISTSESLLVSVKLTKPCTARITVYEEKIKHVEILQTGSALDGTLATYAAVSYKSVDTADFEEADFTSNPALATYTDRVYISPVTYTNTENIGFYTKQIADVTPGIYKIKVQVLDEEGKVEESSSSLVVVKEKPVAEEKQVFEQKPTGALKVIQNLLKSIFK